MFDFILLLASKSTSRQFLLEQAKIPFKVIEQNADESEIDWTLPSQELAVGIALHKMKHAVLPQGKEGEVIYVLTADTVTQDMRGVNHGKPLDKAHAVSMIKDMADGTYVSTAFCLEKKVYANGRWMTQRQVVEAVTAQCKFIVPCRWIESYLNNVSPEVSGAISIEEYGMQFLKDVNGSYSTIIGLPMFELREALEELSK